MGGFPTIRHNKLRDACADLIVGVCHDVCTEPHAPSTTQRRASHWTMTSTSNRVQAGIAASRFWGGQYKCKFFDVRAFDADAPSCLSSSISNPYKRFKSNKRKIDEQQGWQVERGTSTLLVWSSSGCAEKQPQYFKNSECSCCSVRKEKRRMH